LLYYCFTTALLLLYNCFYTALLLFYYCFTTALLQVMYLRAELERERAVSERERERREKERKGWEDLESRVQIVEGVLGTMTRRSADERGRERGGEGGGGGGASGGGGGGEGVAVVLELTSRVVKVEEELRRLQQQQPLQVFTPALLYDSVTAVSSNYV
jgi:hypothetical protein